MKHTLDTREITYEVDGITPKREGKRNWLYWHYKDQGDEITIDTLEIGDWLAVKEHELPKWDRFETDDPFILHHREIYPWIEGNCVEIKIGTDVLDRERLRDELFRMRQWQGKNQHVDTHAIWVDSENKYYHTSKAKIWKQFVSMCSSYHVWPHMRHSGEELIEFLKTLDQPKSYQRDTVYMKRTKEPTPMARCWRNAVDGISSEMAMKLAHEKYLAIPANIFNGTVYYKAERDLLNVIGTKKDGTPKRLYYKCHWFLSYGTKPTKIELDEYIAFLEARE